MKRAALAAAAVWVLLPRLLLWAICRTYKPPDLDDLDVLLSCPPPSSPSHSTSNEQETRTRSDASSSLAWMAEATSA